MTIDSTMDVQVERRDPVAIVRLARPERKNRLDIAMRSAFARAVTELESVAEVRAIVIGSADPGVFAAGADLGLLVDKGAQDMVDLDLGQYWAPIVQSRKPTVAAVSGPALGAGCELALMCDVIVADPTARFGQPELKVGIMPGAGGTQRLARLVGRQVASWMLLSGEVITGERAYQLGMVAELTEAGGALERAIAVAGRMAALPRRAVLATRRVLAHALDLPLDAALALEQREFLLLFDTADKTEGMRAFLEKRPPRWRDR